jgi:uncharacterized membrane protein YhfC
MVILFILICSIILPLFLAALMIKNNKRNIKPILLGALTFIFFQLVLRIPLLQLVLPGTMWYTKLTLNPWSYALFLGLTAAIFEEVGSYVVIRLFMKKNLNPKSGLCFGIGHGGIEAILLVGINVIIALILSLPMGSSYELALGGIERLIAISFHIGMSIMIVKAVQTKKVFWLIIPILLHTITDMLAVIAVYYNYKLYQIELMLLPFAIFALAFSWRELRNERK